MSTHNNALILATISYMKKKTDYPLKPHQIKGLYWCLKRESMEGLKGGLLCDEPGMGKTIQMAALMKANIKDSTLIIVPVCVINQWKTSLGSIFGSDKIYVHTGASRPKHWEELTRLRLGKMDNIIVITTYGVAVSSKKSRDNLLFENSWGRVILDEGHIIRNSGTLSFKKINSIKREHSWILSGTPLQNKLSDIRTLFKFVNNGRCYMTLPDMTKNFMIRRTKKELIGTVNYLDDYIISNVICPFETKEEQDTYMALQRNVMDDYGGIDLELNDSSTMEYLVQILRLRQASIHPELAMKSFAQKYESFQWDRFSNRSTKMKYFLDKINTATGYSLVFCHFRNEMNLVQSELETIGIQSEMYNGSMNASERRAVLDKFPSDKVSKKALIIQIKAGGVGLNLQQFTSIFIISPDWNPCNEIQAIARAHRIGQTKTVTVFKFTVVCNYKFSEEASEVRTIDSLITSKQKTKRELMSNILEDDSLCYNEKLEASSTSFNLADWVNKDEYLHSCR